MINWFRSLLMVVTTGLWTAYGVVVALLDWSGKIYMLSAKYGWARTTLALAGADLRVTGAQNLDPTKTYVVVANHASQVDIPALFAALPVLIRFLAKRSLFFIPIFGWSLALARFVPVDRGSTVKARRSIDNAARKIRKGPSLVVFSEGTRSSDGKLKPFKPGAFVLAIKAGVPVVPVAIRGTFHVLPRNKWSVNPGPVELIIGTPISTEGLTLQDRQSILSATREWIERVSCGGEPG